MNPVINKYGDKLWLTDSVQLHRIDGPAIEFENGDKSYLVNGQLHRTDGPALEWGDKLEWWIDGIQYLEEDFSRILKLKGLL
jgi:hypothetical protein